MDPIKEKLKDFAGVQLAPQQIIFIVTVLVDTVNEISTLRHSFPGCPKVSGLKYTLLRKRLGIDERQKLFGEAVRVVGQPSGAVSNECAFLEVILQKAKVELLTNCSFSSLMEALLIDAQLRADLENLVQTLEKHKKNADLLMKNISEAFLKQSKGSQEKMETILHIKNTIHDLLMEQRLSVSFTAKWEHTRQYLNKRFLLSKEEEATRICDFLQKSITTEIHTHAQYSTAVDKMIVDLENDIMLWTKKCEFDTEEKDQQILNLKMDQSRNQRHLEELTEEFMARQEEIDAFLAYKKEKAERLELEMKLAKMATRIQAWWRGILCRKRLRAKKKKGKKGKKNQKKKSRGKAEKGSKKRKKKS